MQCLRLSLLHHPNIFRKCVHAQAGRPERAMSSSQASLESPASNVATATTMTEGRSWEVPTVAELQAQLAPGTNATCLGRTSRERRCRRPLKSTARHLAHLDLEAYLRSGSQVHPSTRYEQLWKVIGHCTCVLHGDMSTEILDTLWGEEGDTWTKSDEEERVQCDSRSKSSATTKVQSTERDCGHKAKRKPIAGDYLDCEICKLELLTDEELDERKQTIERSKAKIDETRWTKLAWCKAGCGRNYHAQCWIQWLAILMEKRAIPRELACPYCQARWDHRQCGCEREVRFD